MASRLETQHPLLMVPHVYTMSIVIYTDGNAPPQNIGKIVRDALAAQLDPGVGVGHVSVMSHGVYDGK